MRLMITCPETRQIVPSGFSCANLAEFKSNTYIDNYVHCPACSKMHVVDGSTIQVFPEEPTP